MISLPMTGLAMNRNDRFKTFQDDLIDFNPRNLDSWRSPDLRMPRMSLCHCATPVPSQVNHRISGVDGYSSRGSKRVNKSSKVEAWADGTVVRCRFWSQDSYVLPRAKRMISTLYRYHSLLFVILCISLCVSRVSVYVLTALCIFECTSVVSTHTHTNAHALCAHTHR